LTTGRHDGTKGLSGNELVTSRWASIGKWQVKWQAYMESRLGCDHYDLTTRQFCSPTNSKEALYRVRVVLLFARIRETWGIIENRSFKVHSKIKVHSKT